MAENNNNIIKVPGVELNGPVNGEFESENVALRNINDFYTFEKSWAVVGTDAATATNYPIFYVANVACFLIEARMRHTVAGGASSKVHVVKIADGASATGAHKSMLTTGFSLDGTANTVQLRGTTTVLAGFNLRPGDAMALRADGTLTSAENVIVTVLMGINNKDIPTSGSVAAVIL